MATIYLVRHGQAAFGTDDYDRLTDLGIQQSQRLGQYFARIGLHFDALFAGELLRHKQTAEGIVAGMAADSSVPALIAEVFAQLNEYDPEALIAAHTGQPYCAHADAQRRDPAIVREHFRILRDALLAWADGRIFPEGMQSFADFQAGVVKTFHLAQERSATGNVLIVSSGGPIASGVCALLNAPSSTAVELNLRIRNCSTTTLVTTPKRINLLGFNNVSHLEMLGSEHLITFS